jgi:hypothetical protein
MNANELADAIEKGGKDGFFQDEIVAILRQQQAEIDALRNRNWDLVSEPWGFDRHPVKELTDAEIRTIQDMCHLKNVGYNTFIMRFARAILRKAQEK